MTEMKSIHVIGVLLFAAFIDARFVEGRYRRALPPAYLSVEGHQQCLATFQASASHTEKCLPLKPLTECPVQTWSDLQAVLSDGKPQKKKITSRAVQPNYLSIEGHQACLEEFQASETHTEKCLPLQKPLECEQNVWDLLVTEFKDANCPAQKVVGGLAGLPPAYLTVNGYQECLLTVKASESHQGYCFPESKPDECEQASYEELKNVFQGPPCPTGAQESRQIRAGPPAYLSVPSFQKCLSTHQKPGDTHTERCLPSVKPTDCPDDSWNQLQTVFIGDKCLEQGRESRQIRAGPPAYLSVPSFQKCLSEHQKPGDTHTERCLPTVKPTDCPDGSWNQLQTVFVGDKCLEQGRKSRQIRAGPPAYLSVPLFQKCLSEHQKPGDTHTERCLPTVKPTDCPDGSWNQLQTVFVGDKCLEQGKKSRQIWAGPPAYLSVPSFEKCLGDHQKPGDSHREWCKPSVKPSDCPDASWSKLNEVFTGNNCLDESRISRQIRAGPPAYLSVPSFEKCLSEHQKPGDTHTERCLPSLKPTSCPDGSWTQLNKVFQGDKCLEQGRKSRQSIGLGAPEYLQVENFQDCLSEHQQPGESYTVRCLPEAKPDACLDASWEKLSQVFTGDKCHKEERESRQIGLGAPEYLQVENFGDCLGEHQKPDATYTERCLPEVKPDACLVASWEKLGQVFTGDKCPKEERKSRGLSLAVLPPVYLSVVGYEKCLSVHQPSSTHAEKCLPQTKPIDCSDSAWSDLLDVFEGIRCPKQEKVGGPTGLPPAYLSVEGHENCLDVHQASSSHSEKCLPQDQPEDCSEDAWKQLESVFDGIHCPPLRVGGEEALPPPYLFVEKFDNCLEIHKPSPSHSEYCLPQVKPEACASSSWSEIITLFEGIRCPALQDGQVSQNPPHIGVGGIPPAYLGVEGHQNCLGSQVAISGSHNEKCLPSARPQECSVEAWNKLSEVFEGNPCSTQQPILVGGPSALPPAYLNVAGHEDCLDVHQPTQTFSEKCLPQFQPADCSGQAWRKLNQVFDGIRCSTGKNVASSQSGFLSIDGQDNCLGYHQIDDDHTVKCLPYDKPAGCENQAWQLLQTAFTGIGCPRDVPDVVTAGAPAYLSIEGHGFCLGTYRASETHTEKCLPREKLEDCDDSAWDALPKVFTGIRCPNSKPKAGSSSQVVDLSRASNQLPEGYQRCVGEQLASENHMEKCLPELKPEACSETTWDDLVSNFIGYQCRRQPNALPPHYLSIQGHENCLETLQASETHTEVCLPRVQPEECPVDAWESLQITYEGNTCREGRAEPFPDLPTSVQSISGSKECLRLFQITESHQESCLPLTRPQGCTQEAFEALQDLAFSAQLPRDARQTGPAVAGLPPAYLSVEGHQLCLGSHQASETHKEVCLPADKPAECSDDSWSKIKNVFEGEACRTGRLDDHVNFPQSPQGPGHKVDVVHRPGVDAEIPLAFCNTDGDCFSNDREQICNLFFFAVNDNSGTSWDGVCVPSFCDSLGKCPLVGDLATGAVSGRCKRRSQTCQYDQALIQIPSR